MGMAMELMKLALSCFRKPARAIRDMLFSIHSLETSASKPAMSLAETTKEGMPKFLAKLKAGESARVNTARAICTGRLCFFQYSCMADRLLPRLCPLLNTAIL